MRRAKLSDAAINIYLEVGAYFDMEGIHVVGEMFMCSICAKDCGNSELGSAGRLLQSILWDTRPDGRLQKSPCFVTSLTAGGQNFVYGQEKRLV